MKSYNIIQASQKTCTTFAMIFTILALCFLNISCVSISSHGVHRIRETELVSPALPASLEGYRIAFVSDIHFGNHFNRKRLDTLIASVNESKADCIILGGDLTLGTSQIREFALAASALKALEGVYAVLGNHDYYNGRNETIRTLRNAGIIVLDEISLTTPRGLVLAGINDFRDIFPPMKQFQDILDEEQFTVLASHNPDFAEKISSEELALFDLILSGHTHGGQITFFGYAPVIPSEYGQRYRTGIVYKDQVPVVVSNGAGYGGNLLRFRFCTPSDFLVITLHSSDQTSSR